jgi:hypothetical protein
LASRHKGVGEKCRQNDQQSICQRPQWSGKVVHGSLSVAADGTIELEQPLFRADAKQGMSWIAKDVGPLVAAILKRYRHNPEILQQPVYAVTDHYSLGEVCNEIQKQTGREVHHIIPPSSGLPDLDLLYGYANEWGLLTDVPLPDPHTVSLGVKLHTLEDFVRDGVFPYLQENYYI